MLRGLFNNMVIGWGGGGGCQLKSIIGWEELDHWSPELFSQSRQDKEEKDGGFKDACGFLLNQGPRPRYF
jgi:hypothetical protein